MITVHDKGNYFRVTFDTLETFTYSKPYASCWTASDLLNYLENTHERRLPMGNRFTYGNDKQRNHRIDAKR